MQVSKRIMAVVSQIAAENLADIGTDHGYIAIESIKQKRAKRVIACDINKGPLARAKVNVDSCNLSDQIELRLGNGLLPVAPNEVDCVSIGGMGGMLMIDILKASQDVVCGLNQMVLQPQLDIIEVRKYIHEIGFFISNEVMLFEDKYYNVIKCERGTEPAYTEAEYLLGKTLIDRKDEYLKKFLLKQIDVYEKIALNLNHESTRYLEVTENIKLNQEVLKCFGSNG